MFILAWSISHLFFLILACEFRLLLYVLFLLDLWLLRVRFFRDTILFWALVRRACLAGVLGIVRIKVRGRLILVDRVRNWRLLLSSLTRVFSLLGLFDVAFLWARRKITGVRRYFWKLILFKGFVLNLILRRNWPHRHIIFVLIQKLFRIITLVTFILLLFNKVEDGFSSLYARFV